MTKIAGKITEIFILKLLFNVKDYIKNYLKGLYKTFCQNTITKNTFRLYKIRHPFIDNLAKKFRLT